MKINAWACGFMAAAAISTTMQAQQSVYEKPNLTETNLRGTNPEIGIPADYLLLQGTRHYLRFDVPVASIRIDDETVIDIQISDDRLNVVLVSKSYGSTRLLIEGAKKEGVDNPKLLLDAIIAVGFRRTIMDGKTHRIVAYDCTPVCSRSPTTKLRAPDQIIENRNFNYNFNSGSPIQNQQP